MNNEILTQEDVSVIETETNNTEETIVVSTDSDAVETIYCVNGQETHVLQNADDSNIEENVESGENQNKEQQNVRVNTKALNIRNNPSKDGNIVSIVYENDLLMLIEPNSINGFYKIVTREGIEGYCMEQFVELV